MEGTKLGIVIVAIAAVGVPVVLRLLLEVEKHLARTAKSGKRVVTAK